LLHECGDGPGACWAHRLQVSRKIRKLTTGSESGLTAEGKREESFAIYRNDPGEFPMAMTVTVNHINCNCFGSDIAPSEPAVSVDSDLCDYFGKKNTNDSCWPLAGYEPLRCDEDFFAV
jgi:hypothetical protein